jgi:hypothetical protein
MKWCLVFKIVTYCRSAKDKEVYVGICFCSSYLATIFIHHRQRACGTNSKARCSRGDTILFIGLHVIILCQFHMVICANIFWLIFTLFLKYLNPL